MKHLLTFLVLLSLVACTNQQDKDRISQLEKQMVALKEEVKKQASFASLDDQNRCSKQADEVWRGLSSTDQKKVHRFENHYNKKLGRCFVKYRKLEETPPRYTISQSLLDAFENKSYGEVWLSGRDDEKVDAVEPVICGVITDGKMKNCKSEKGYDQLAKPYMTD